MKKTLVLGASPDSSRYSYKAVESLRKHGHEVVAIGKRGDKIGDVPIEKTMVEIENVHTITLYMRDSLQAEYYDYIFSLNPQRIIFNPGTYNDELIEMAEQKGIEAVDACTLVMLASGQF